MSDVLPDPRPTPSRPRSSVRGGASASRVLPVLPTRAVLRLHRAVPGGADGDRGRRRIPDRRRQLHPEQSGQPVHRRRCWPPSVSRSRCPPLTAVIGAVVGAVLAYALVDRGRNSLRPQDRRRRVLGAGPVRRHHAGFRVHRHPRSNRHRHQIVGVLFGVESDGSGCTGSAACVLVYTLLPDPADGAWCSCRRWRACGRSGGRRPRPSAGRPGCSGGGWPARCWPRRSSGSTLLLFANAFSAYATAAALITQYNTVVPLQIRGCADQRGEPGPGQRGQGRSRSAWSSSSPSSWRCTPWLQPADGAVAADDQDRSGAGPLPTSGRPGTAPPAARGQAPPADHLPVGRRDRRRAVLPRPAPRHAGLLHPARCPERGPARRGRPWSTRRSWPRTTPPAVGRAEELAGPGRTDRRAHGGAAGADHDLDPAAGAVAAPHRWSSSACCR